MAQALGDLPRAQWLEPCVGDGVFLEALAARGIQRSRIRALDINEVAAPADHLARTLRTTEYLEWSVHTRERFSRIIGNPPFLAMNRAPLAIQRTALDITIPSTNGKLTLGTNCWFAFLCSSVGLLRLGGSLAFVLPAAWEYADYASPLRSGISALFEEVRVFRSREPLFRVVQEGSIVLIARGYRLQRHDSRRAITIHHDYDTAEELIAALHETAPQEQNRRAGDKAHIVTNVAFTLNPDKSQRAESPAVTLASSLPALRVKDVFRIRLGGVTGDARYFLLTDADRRRWNIPTSACRPVISRASHLSQGVIDHEEWTQLKEDGERVWLFDPKPSQINRSSIKAYLDLPTGDGGCNKTALKVRVREPWYRTPIPRRIDGFMSGMSGWGPWVVFSEMPGLAATNTLYVVQFVHRMERDARAAWAMWLLTTEASRHLHRIRRRYADGLVKYEPGDVAELPIRKPLKIDGAYEEYLRAVRLLVKGHKTTSRQVADDWFGQPWN
jgi:methylase of polypeptide subunit release factors